MFTVNISILFFLSINFSSLVVMVDSFVPQGFNHHKIYSIQNYHYQHHPPITVPSHRIRSALNVVADAPLEKEKGEEEDQQNRRRSDNNNDDGTDWIPTREGGFIPNLKSVLQRNNKNRSPTKPTILEVKDIQMYKQVVADEREQIVCVRFYAPWCRACRAVEPLFRRLSHSYPNVKFVEVPATEDNAYLHQGLGIPSLPFGHIYHPQGGLVEELKINKKEFGRYSDSLKTYVDEYCPVAYQEGENGLESILDISK